MKFSIATLLAAAGLAIAQTAGFDAITSPTQDQTLQPGSSFEIVWDPATVKGTITIALLQGASPSKLQVGPTVASSIDNQLGKFVWSPVPESQFATYGFKITLDSDPSTFQYSFPFHIAASSASSTTAPATTAPATTAPAAPGASYPAGNATTECTTSTTTTSECTTSTTTTSECTTSTPAVNYPTTLVPVYPVTTPAAYPTYPASNGTVPSGTECASTTVPSHTAPIGVPQGAAPRFGASGLAAVAGLVLAFAL